MVDLKKYVCESLSGTVLESIGSEKIQNAFSDRSGKVKNFDLRHYLGIELQWDKITDGDVEEMSTEEARQLAYKKDSKVYIIWLDPRGKFQARTIGNYIVFLNWSLRGKVRNTVKAISIASDKALVIQDVDRFSTKELQKERAEQKKGALALMDAADVAKANLKRYKDILNQKKLQEFNLGDVVQQVQEVLKKYGETISKISSNLVVATDYRTVTDALDDIEIEIQRIMSDFKKVLSSKADYDRFSKYYGSIAEDYRTRLVGATDRLSKEIDEFYRKYIDDYAE